MTRENLDNLPYSVTEIYGLHSSGKYNTAEPVYHHLHRIYPSDLLRGKEHPNMVIVEDSNAGYEFFEHYYHESDVNCISAKGSGNIFDMIHKAYDGNVVVIADGAAFGAQMGRVFPEIKRRQNIRLYLPESFEWIILSADILENSKDSGKPIRVYRWRKIFQLGAIFYTTIIGRDKGNISRVCKIIAKY